MFILELFAGARSIGKAAEKLGHEVFSIDWTAYEGINKVMDIANLSLSDLPKIPDHVHASFDCTTYTVAALSLPVEMALSLKQNTPFFAIVSISTLYLLLNRLRPPTLPVLFLLKILGVCLGRCLGCKSLRDTLFGIANTVTIEQSQRIFGPILKVGYPGLFAIMEI